MIILMILVLLLFKETIQTKNSVEQLGMYLNTKLSFWEQVNRASEKDHTMTMALSTLIANVGGPK